MVLKKRAFWWLSWETFQPTWLIVKPAERFGGSFDPNNPVSNWLCVKDLKARIVFCDLDVRNVQQFEMSFRKTSSKLGKTSFIS